MKFSIEEIIFSISFNLMIILHLFKPTLGIEYNYKDTGSWSKHWPACGGKRQSPIDINMNDLDYSHSNNKLKIENYEVVPRRSTLFNNGHAVQIKYEWGDRRPIMSGGILNGKYRIDSLHFHWNSRNNNGSEHTFEGRRAAIELHHLHYNIKYRSVAEALYHDDGLMILCDLLFTEALKSTSIESPVVRQVLDKFPNVSQPGSSIDIESFPLASLAPPDAENIKWINYLGSLTVPPCTENVIWTLNTFPHLINNEVVRHARESVRFKNNDDHNFREIQPLNGRRLFATGTGPISSS